MDVKSLEHPTLKVPYEVLNKKFRAAQKNVDRESSKVQNELSELEKRLVLVDATPTVGEVSAMLDNVVEKLHVMKRKATESIGDELDAARVCKRRTDHLKEHDTANVNLLSQWKKKRLDRILVEYFLRCGYYETAIKLARHNNIEDLTNLDLFLVAKEVEESLLDHDTSKCLNWCYDNKSKLKKMKSNLEFNLRQQEFIELIRNDRRLEAVEHARKYFVSLEDDQMVCVQRTMGLLAFPMDTEVNPYAEMLNPNQWHKLVKEFRSDNFKLYQLNNYSVFTVTLQAGLSSLKTPQCYHDDTKNPDCPVCSPYLNELASKLPFAHCSQSRLVCHMSSAALNEHNHPMMLPNGYIYGENALMSMAASSNGKVVCPRTKQDFSITDAEKVFVM